MAPGRATGTLLASADGEAIGGKPGAAPSDLSETSSSLEGLGLGSVGGFLFSALRTDGDAVGEGDGLLFSLSAAGVFPFSSSSTLPTNFELVSVTSFSAANTEAPRTVTS